MSKAPPDREEFLDGARELLAHVLEQRDRYGRVRAGAYELIQSWVSQFDAVLQLPLPRPNRWLEHRSRWEYELFDGVRVKKDLPEDGVLAGTRGAIVEILDKPRRAYIVEFCDGEGRTLALPVLLAADIEPAEPEKPSV